eukprot:Awhi_evm1s8765
MKFSQTLFSRTLTCFQPSRLAFSHTFETCSRSKRNYVALSFDKRATRPRLNTYYNPFQLHSHTYSSVVVNNEKQVVAESSLGSVVSKTNVKPVVEACPLFYKSCRDFGLDSKPMYASVSGKAYNNLILHCIKRENFDLAINLFSEMDEHKVNKDVVSYTQMISLYTKKDKIKKALKVFERMKVVGVKPNVVTYNCIITALGRAEERKYFLMALDFLKEMPKKGVVPDVGTYSSLITSCGRRGRDGMAFDFYHEMKKKKIPPNNITYTALLCICEDNKLFKEAWKLYLHMKSEHIPLSKNMYHHLLRTCVKSKQLSQGLSIFKEMKKNESIELDAVTYSAVISLYANSFESSEDGFDKGIGVYTEMKRKLINPKIFTYTALFSLCKKYEKYDEALAFLEEMKAKKIRPTIFNYEILIDLFGSSPSRFQSAFDLHNDMVQERIPNHSYIYDSLIRICLTHNQIENGFLYYEKMKAEWIKPKSNTFNYLIQLCTKNSISFLKEYESVSSFSTMMPKAETTIDSDNHNTATSEKEVIQAKGLKTFCTTGVNLFKTMQTQGIKPNQDTFISLFALFDATKEMGSAFGLFHRLNTKETALTLPCYVHLFSLCEKQGQIDDGLEVWTKMKEKSVKPNTACLNAFLSLCRKTKDSDSALKKAMLISDEMKSRRVSFDLYSFNLLISLCKDEMNFPVALDFYTEIQESGLSPDASTFSNLLEICNTPHHLEKIVGLLTEAKKTGLQEGSKDLDTALATKQRDLDLKKATVSSTDNI